MVCIVKTDQDCFVDLLMTGSQMPVSKIYIQDIMSAIQQINHKTKFLQNVVVNLEISKHPFTTSPKLLIPQIQTHRIHFPVMGCVGTSILNCQKATDYQWLGIHE